MALYDWGARGLNTGDPKHIPRPTPDTGAIWQERYLPMTWFILRPCIVNGDIHITLPYRAGPKRLVLPSAESSSPPAFFPIGEEPLLGHHYHCGHRRLIAFAVFDRKRPIPQFYYAHQPKPNGPFEGTAVEWPSKDGIPLPSFFGFDLFTSTILLFDREQVYSLCVLGD